MSGRYRAEITALFSGALLPLAFAPFHLFPLAFIAPAILFLLWHKSSAKQSALLGFLFGLGAFGVGVSWVYVAIHVFGNMPAILAGISTLGFVSLLSFFYAFTGYVQAQFLSSALLIRYVVVLPALWVLLEWVRGWVLTGFPWLNLGYSQIQSPIGNIAPWLGVFGVSYLVALIAGVIVWAKFQNSKKQQLFAAGFISVAVLILVGLSYIQLTVPTSKPVKVALVQGNISLTRKWHAEYREQTMHRYLELSRKVRHADLIVWPEAAVPGYLQYVDQSFLQQMTTEARLYATDFLFGVLDLDSSRNSTYYNSVAVLGSHNAVYRKTHLVPFGEYTPLEPVFRWIMQSMSIPMSNFTPGASNQSPLMVAGQLAAVSICYENLFGEEVIGKLPQATMLINVSENAWYGNSLAPHQLVQMAQMRSLETGRPGIRVDNAGPSVLIGPNGRILSATEQFKESVLVGTIQPRTGTTPYVRWGNSIIIAWLLVMLVSGIWLRRRFTA